MTATAGGTALFAYTTLFRSTATVTYTNVAPAIQVVKSASPTSVREGGVGGEKGSEQDRITITSTAGVPAPSSNVTLGDTDGTPTYVIGDTNNDSILQNTETW